MLARIILPYALILVESWMQNWTLQAKIKMHLFYILQIVALLYGISKCSEILEPDRQTFTRYDWLEKLLERSIRTDIQIQEYNKAVEKALAAINTHNAELKGLKTSLVSVVEDLKEKVENQTKLLNQVIQNVTTLQERILIPTIYFNAIGLRDKSPHDSQVIILPSVIENVGNAYNAGTGVFQSPVNGTYLFSVQVCSYSNQPARVNLVVDSGDSKITAVTLYTPNGGNLGTSNTVVQYLREGQRVWTQSFYESGTTNMIYHDVNHCWSQFSGVLVNY